jgi:AI-2 transport protein TqsA
LSGSELPEGDSVRHSAADEFLASLLAAAGPRFSTGPKSTTMTSNRGHLTLLGICAAILVLMAFYFVRTVLAPVVFALFAIALVWPLQAYLQARMPKLIAALITCVLVIVVVATLAALIGWGFGRAARWLLADLGRFQAMYQEAAAWFEKHGFVITGVFGEVFNGSWVVAMLQRVGSRLQGILSFAIVTLIYILLGLLEVDTIATKLRGLRNREIGESLVAAAGQAAVKLQKYMRVRTVMSVMTGALVFGFALLIGLPLAAEWGVIAFALNYVPFLGSFIATIAPTLFAFAQFESWEMALFVFVCLNVIQFVVGSYLEPRIAGSALSLSPFLVLFAIFLWSFLWGISGAFIGVPIVIAILAVCEQYPASRWVSEVLGGTDSKAT